MFGTCSKKVWHVCSQNTKKQKKYCVIRVVGEPEKEFAFHCVRTESLKWRLGKFVLVADQPQNLVRFSIGEEDYKKQQAWWKFRLAIIQYKIDDFKEQIPSISQSTNNISQNEFWV